VGVGLETKLVIFVCVDLYLRLYTALSGKGNHTIRQLIQFILEYPFVCQQS